MDCGRCGETMVPIALRGLELDWCPCRSVFFDGGELDAWVEGEVEAGLRAVRAQGRAKGVTCSRCAAPMVEVEHAGLRVDACTACPGVLVVSLADLEEQRAGSNPILGELADQGKKEAVGALLTHAPDLVGGDLLEPLLGALGELLGSVG